VLTSSTISDIVSELGIPAGEEIKWNPPRGSFLRGADGHLVKTLRRRMLEAAIGRQVSTVTVIIDHDARYQSYSKPELGKTILKWLYERVSMHLDDHGDVGIMIADKPGGGTREERRWLAETLELTSDGTEYVEPGRVVLPVVTADPLEDPRGPLSADGQPSTKRLHILPCPALPSCAARSAQLKGRHMTAAEGALPVRMPQSRCWLSPREAPACPLPGASAPVPWTEHQVVLLPGRRARRRRRSPRCCGRGAGRVHQSLARKPAAWTIAEGGLPGDGHPEASRRQGWTGSYSSG
jgi:hypothetical protein